MTEWNDEALVLRTGYFHEADMWLKLLCRKHGLFTIFAFGGAKSKKRFCGCLDLFNSLSCRVKYSRNGRFLNLQEASLLEAPRNLRDNYNAMGIAANCLLFAEAAGIGSDNAAQCYLVLEELRDFLERSTQPDWATVFYFRLRLATILGLWPDLRNCAHCGRQPEHEALFMANQGRILCERCGGSIASNERQFAVSISARLLQPLRLIQTGSIYSWPVLHGHDARACLRLIDSFVQFHMGLVWENGFFRHV